MESRLPYTLRLRDVAVPKSAIRQHHFSRGQPKGGRPWASSVHTLSRRGYPQWRKVRSMLADLFLRIRTRPQWTLPYSSRNASFSCDTVFPIKLMVAWSGLKTGFHSEQEFFTSSTINTTLKKHHSTIANQVVVCCYNMASLASKHAGATRAIQKAIAIPKRVRFSESKCCAMLCNSIGDAFCHPVQSEHRLCVLPGRQDACSGPLDSAPHY